MSRKPKFILAALAAGLLAAGAYAAFAGHKDSSLGQRINAAIDDLQAAGIRILDLPLFMLLAASALLAALVTAALQTFTAGKLASKRLVITTLVFLLLTCLAIAADRHIGRLESEITTLRAKISGDRMTAAEIPNAPADPSTLATKQVAKITADPARAASPAPSQKRTALLFDRDAARNSLAAHFDSPALQPLVYDRASDLIKVTSNNPLFVAYLSIIDLTTPGVQVKVGGNFAAKTLTSDYAVANNCSIAINGEAGNAPEANSGLGVWRGHMISEGHVILSELAGNPRPFLSFDKESHAAFTALAAPQRVAPVNAYNLIWGRLDALVNGTVQTDPERNRQPRTAMGLSNDGTKLFLMVVDGRQQRYSVGFTRAEVGQFMQAFGAHNAMLCDEGGSSCMYVRQWSIVNSPSDGGERYTYTHFGVVTPK